MAFEPFPGNHEFFYQSTMRLDNITVIKKAVSESVGVAEFTVRSVVQGTEPRWEKYAGYSSVGFLSPEVDDAHPSIPSAERARRPPPQQRLIVETTSIDTEFSVGEPIDFMKIDVQGGEIRVLLGADGMLRTRSDKPPLHRMVGRSGGSLGTGATMDIVSTIQLTWLPREVTM